MKQRITTSRFEQKFLKRFITERMFVALLFLLFLNSGGVQAQSLHLNEKGYYEAPGLNVLSFSNWYNGLFSDSKISGIEIIHCGERTATNGDVRLNATPEQWNPIPTFIKRTVDTISGRIDTFESYPDYDFEYMIRTEPKNGGILISVHLKKPLPNELAGKAGLNLEFIPSAYWGETFLADDQSGNFPLYPSSVMKKDGSGIIVPQPFAKAKELILAPGDSQRRVHISSDDTLMMFDGRNKAQNGWYVVRSLLPSGRTGKVLEWLLKPNIIPEWTRKPVIEHSQIGYHPSQKKVAVIELDPNDTPLDTAFLMKITSTGERVKVKKGNLKKWGNYTRYKYYQFDFSDVRDPGVYELVYGGETSDPFRIADDVYDKAWYPTNDIYFPVQMDHMLINEAYRVWHGASHLDDALQAPVDHEHFDLYAQGPTTDSPYEPGEHIPGLNVGGWYDAGDYDIRTQTQYYVVSNLVMLMKILTSNEIRF